jgi:hypothetical protein
MKRLCLRRGHGPSDLIGNIDAMTVPEPARRGDGDLIVD